MTAVAIIIGLTFASWVAWTHSFGAPWVPASRTSVEAMLDAAAVGDGDIVFDLGCGDGRVVAAAARDRGARAVGIEVDPIRYCLAWLRIRLGGLGNRVHVVFGDFFDVDVSEATVVTAFLLERTNADLVAKLCRELRPGARIVSKSFRFPGLPTAAEHPDSGLYVYII